MSAGSRAREHARPARHKHEHDLEEKNKLNLKEEDGHNLEVEHERNLDEEDGCDIKGERN